jgi:hypothetical protein
MVFGFAKTRDHRNDGRMVGGQVGAFEVVTDSIVDRNDLGRVSDPAIPRKPMALLANGYQARAPVRRQPFTGGSDESPKAGDFRFSEMRAMDRIYGRYAKQMTG